MGKVKLAERSDKLISSVKAIRRLIGMNGTFVITAMVLFATGFYSAVLYSSPGMYQQQLSITTSVSAPLPDSEKAKEFYRAQAGQDKWIFKKFSAPILTEPVIVEGSSLSLGHGMVWNTPTHSFLRTSSAGMAF